MPELKNYILDSSRLEQRLLLGDGSGVGVNPSGTLKDAMFWVTPQMFGAKADGVTDDYLAIHKANRYLMSIGGGVLFYPAGVYAVSRAIRLDSFDYIADKYVGNIPKGIIHRGAGAGATTIKAISYNNCFSSFPEPYVHSSTVEPTLRGSDLYICDMTIDCNYEDLPDYGTARFSNSSHQYEVSKLGGKWGNGKEEPKVAIYACDNYQFPIYMERNERVYIERCQIKSSWYNGIELYKCKKVFVNNNHIINCGDKKNVYGFYSAVEPDNGCIDIHITENHIEFCGNGVMSNGDSLSYATDPVSSVYISNNKIKNINGNGIYGFGWVQNWHINGNEFDNIGRSPIYIFEDNNPKKATSRNPDKINVIGNIINSFNIENTDATGIRVEAITANINSNTVINRNSTTSNTRAILVSDSNIDLKSDEFFSVIVSDNIIKGRFFTDENNGVIYVSQENVYVHGNLIHSHGKVAEVPVVVYKAGCKIADNKIIGKYKYRLPYRILNSSSSIVDNDYNPYFEAKITSTQVNLSSKYYIIDWNSWGEIAMDTLSIYNTSSCQMRAPYDGYYSITLSGKMQQASNYIVGIEVNGVMVDQVSGAASDGVVDVQVTSTVKLKSGEVALAKVYNNASDWNLRAGTRITFNYVGSFSKFNQ
ncbi:right-handed parallel beta-helix repeat-containing protein [Xenorhabdus bharatensis]|uniref:right-handed parallel beta-helix repeat-containing protein n=1 Tax=Xenorhabdus bharatensis TaxID=3136256 RepID=UPI0030F484CB